MRTTIIKIFIAIGICIIAFWKMPAVLLSEDLTISSIGEPLQASLFCVMPYLVFCIYSIFRKKISFFYPVIGGSFLLVLISWMFKGHINSMLWFSVFVNTSGILLVLFFCELYLYLSKKRPTDLDSDEI